MKPWTPGEAPAGAEQAFFLGQGLAVVAHAARGSPRGTVVLAGPMSLERSHASLTWVRLARSLALEGYEVLRFDYRGVGESLGAFSEASFDDWYVDLCTVLEHARARGGPVLLVGLRLGALLGRRALDSNLASGLVALDPPLTGRALLLELLRRKLAADYMELGGERKSRDDYVRALEAGQLVEVEGYAWSRALWRSAQGFTFGLPVPERCEVIWLDGRPTERLGEREISTRIPKPAFWLQSAHLVPELSELFTLLGDRLQPWSGSARPPQPPEGISSSGGRVLDSSGLEGGPGAGAALSSSSAASTSSQPEGPEPSPGPAQPRASASSGGRLLETVELESGRCAGTAHLPATRTGRLGVLWLNFGYVPRDGHGGLATQASDALASRGIPCFRFDLPGLGDAAGPLPAHTSQFFPFVTSGGSTAVTSQLVRTLCERHGLEGLVLGGLCGGAVNALFTADRERSLVKGIVLLEPELYVTEPTAAEPPPSARTWPFEPTLRHLRSRLFSYWGWMRLLTQENRFGRWVPLPRKRILELVLGGSGLPQVANLPLALAWQRYVRAGRPALVITASGKLREVFFDRINHSVLPEFPSGTPSCQHVRLEGTNHIFTTEGASAAVIDHLLRWWDHFTARAGLRSAS